MSVLERIAAYKHEEIAAAKKSKPLAELSYESGYQYGNRPDDHHGNQVRIYIVFYCFQHFGVIMLTGQA